MWTVDDASFTDAPNSTQVRSGSEGYAAPALGFIDLCIETATERGEPRGIPKRHLDARASDARSRNFLRAYVCSRPVGWKNLSTSFTAIFLVFPLHLLHETVLASMTRLKTLSPFQLPDRISKASLSDASIPVDQK